MCSRLLFSTALELTFNEMYSNFNRFSIVTSSASNECFDCHIECEERAYRLSHRAQSRCVHAFCSRLRSNRHLTECIRADSYRLSHRARATSVSIVTSSAVEMCLRLLFSTALELTSVFSVTSRSSNERIEKGCSAII